MSTLGRATGRNRVRKKNDLYPTIDPRAVPPLIAAMALAGDGPVYAEPCAGEGDLMHLLSVTDLRCLWACDIEPKRRYIARHNALELIEADCAGVDCFITNPMWTRVHLHQFILRLSALRPTWLLFDAAWMMSQQAAPFRHLCSHVVAVGRLKFFPDRGPPLRVAGESEADYKKRSRRNHDPPDDCAWYRFDGRHGGATEYVWRQPRGGAGTGQMELGI